LNFYYDTPDASGPVGSTFYDKYTSGYYDGYYFEGAVNYGNGFAGGFEAYGYNLWWMPLAASNPVYSVGDTATVVGFSSVQTGDNTVDNAFELVGAGSVGSSNAAGLIAGAAIVLGAASLF
jgi:hypothetical protein